MIPQPPAVGRQAPRMHTRHGDPASDSEDEPDSESESGDSDSDASENPSRALVSPDSAGPAREEEANKATPAITRKQINTMKPITWT